MLAVTQFEVYVMQDGRWILHARYPADDRQEALWDAKTTEIDTGFPSKVVRETYFPEINESERITTYLSPKAKKNPKGPAAEDAARVAQPLRGRLRSRRQQPPMTAGHVALRVLVAAGFSLVGAALTAGILNWTLRRMGDLGLNLASSTESMLLTYSYVGMFLLFFLSLFRSRLPLHRLLADLWNRAQPATTAAGQRPKDAKPARVKPKYDRATSPETLREWQELRVRRGDPDIFQTAGEAPTTTTAASPAPAPPAVALPPELPTADLVKAEKPKPPPAPPAAKSEPPAKPVQKPKPVEAPPVVEDETDFAHVELRRFSDEVIKPALLATMHDDPVTRRGTALVLTGAIDAVMQRPEARSVVPSSLLSWSLRQAGLTQGVIDLFVLQRPIHIALASNQPLVAEGKAAMEQMLDQGKTVRELVDAMAVALAAWRTPYGQPGLLVHPAAEAAVVTAGAATLVDVFLITELRPRQLQSDTPERMAGNEGPSRSSQRTRPRRAGRCSWGRTETYRQRYICPLYQCGVGAGLRRRPAARTRGVDRGGRDRQQRARGRSNLVLDAVSARRSSRGPDRGWSIHG